jgi:circadian clock protein KaiC
VAIPSEIPTKCPTGIRGLDEITVGGLPRGRPTLVCGGAGCGKTLLGVGSSSVEQGNPNPASVSRSKTAQELTNNVASLEFDLARLRTKLEIDHISIERSMIEEAGEYDLEALFVRIGHAVDLIGAKRVLLDSVEALYAGLDNEAVLRSELRRLFRWLKERGLTAIVTGERGDGALTRHGMEEYISDCVILLDHHLIETVLTRRVRIVKYRGSTHGTNEYPFLMTRRHHVLPVTSID